MSGRVPLKIYDDFLSLFAQSLLKLILNEDKGADYASLRDRIMAKTPYEINNLRNIT